MTCIHFKSRMRELVTLLPTQRSVGASSFSSSFVVIIPRRATVRGNDWLDMVSHCIFQLRLALGFLTQIISNSRWRLSHIDYATILQKNDNGKTVYQRHQANDNKHNFPPLMVEQARSDTFIFICNT